MATQRGYLTPTQHEEYSNREIPTTGDPTANETEWYRQANIAESLIDNLCYGKGKFHPSKESSFLSGSLSTVKLTNLTLDKDDYYNYLRVRIVQGTGKGYVGRITAYVGSTKLSTVSPVFSVQPDTTSVFIVDQPQVFPRMYDYDPGGRPVILEDVSRATSAIMEYWDTVGSACGINSDVFNKISAGVSSESIGDYSITYDGDEGFSYKQMIGAKAYFILEKAGFIVRTAMLVG